MSKATANHEPAPEFVLLRMAAVVCVAVFCVLHPYRINRISCMVEMSAPHSMTISASWAEAPFQLKSRELGSASHIGSKLQDCYTAIQKGHARNQDHSGGHQVEHDQKLYLVCDIERLSFSPLIKALFPNINAHGENENTNLFLKGSHHN